MTDYDAVIFPVGQTGGTTVTVYYKMRALADPGPGYVVWTVQGAPDPTGVEAPEAIQEGTAVVAATWSE